MAVHASHAALPYPIKGARFSLLVPYLDDDGDPTAPTTPDTEISIDNGAAADCAEEVSATSGMAGMSLLTLSGAETDCSCAALNAKVASGPKATLVELYPRVLASVGTGTLSAGSASGGTLGTLLTYDITGCFVKTTGGTGGGGTGGANNQARKIATYNTTTGAFTVVPNWETTPDATTTYDILLPEGTTLGMLRALNPTTPGRTVNTDTNGKVPSTIAAGDIANDVITASTIATDAITNTKVADGFISVNKIADNSISGAKLATNCITAAKIATDAITDLEISAAAVTKIQTGLATPTNITAASGITLADGAITTVKIADGAFTAVKFAADLLTAVASAIRTELTVELARIDVTISTRLAAVDYDVPGDATEAKQDAIIAEFTGGDIDGFTRDEALKVALAALAGKASGADVNAPVFRSVDDAKDRITATTDADGNRLTVTLDAT